MATRAMTVCIIITKLNEKSLQFRGIRLGVKAILCEWLLKREREGERDDFVSVSGAYNSRIGVKGYGIALIHRTEPNLCTHFIMPQHVPACTPTQCLFIRAICFI